MDCIHDYLELQKLRTEGLNIEFNVKGEVTSQEIAPLLLIPFIENAFKHGKKEASTVIILLTLQNNRLTLRVENEMTGLKIETEGGLGIPNARRRLELQYPEAYDLRIGENEGKFCVNLSIKL